MDRDHGKYDELVARALRTGRHSHQNALEDMVEENTEVLMIRGGGGTTSLASSMIVSLLYFGRTCYRQIVALVASHTHEHILHPLDLDSIASYLPTSPSLFLSSFRLSAEEHRYSGHGPISHLDPSAPPLVLSSFPGALSVVYLVCLYFHYLIRQSVEAPDMFCRSVPVQAAHLHAPPIVPFPPAPVPLRRAYSSGQVHVQEHQTTSKDLELRSLVYIYLMRGVPAINKPKDVRAFRLQKQPTTSSLL
ncbi:hypothetical protein QBC45DRAFT_22356 [Copromyces sp. CBS 386.78]|nr:hypothetical protein QBC45DRAFT_22356 [Copromyces sp. CBS 386.78]